MSRINIAAFAAQDMIEEANHLAMAVGQGPDDGATYGWAGWQNDTGRYCLRDVMVGLDWLARASSPLERPEWDVDRVINMAAARRAQAAIRLWLPPEGEAEAAPFPQPAPGLIVVYAGIDTASAISAAGVVRVEE